MSDAIIKRGEYVKYPPADGVYLKHFFGKNENVAVNTFEILILPGFTLPPHVHDNTTEFFHVLSGDGEIWDNGVWKPFKKGDASFAVANVEHGLRNTGQETMICFAVFSPVIM